MAHIKIIIVFDSYDKSILSMKKNAGVNSVTRVTCNEKVRFRWIKSQSRIQTLKLYTCPSAMWGKFQNK